MLDRFAYHSCSASLSIKNDLPALLVLLIAWLFLVSSPGCLAQVAQGRIRLADRYLFFTDSDVLASGASHKSRPIFYVGEGALSQDSSGAIVLKSGSVFICPPKDIDILTSLGVVKAKAHSRFFLVLAQDASSLSLLNCSSHEIVFFSGKKYRHIKPFEEFRFYDHRPTRQEVLPADGLARKEVVLHDIDGQSTAATNSFLLTSMLASPYYLGNWQRDSAFDKKLLKALLKSQAALDSASPSAEQFYVSPDLYKGLH